MSIEPPYWYGYISLLLRLEARDREEKDYLSGCRSLVGGETNLGEWIEQLEKDEIIMQRLIDCCKYENKIQQLTTDETQQCITQLDREKRGVDNLMAPDPKFPDRPPGMDAQEAADLLAEIHKLEQRLSKHLAQTQLMAEKVHY